jgi:hypothetical protein
VTVPLLDRASLDERRSTLGSSTVLWAGVDGVRVDRDRWVALSGAPTAEYNAALVYGDGETLDQTVEEVLEAGAPAVVMVAGPAVDEASRLEDRDWIPIGSTALMHRDLRAHMPAARASAARRLGRADHPAVRELVGEVFGVGPRLASVAISGLVEGLDGHALWGAFDSTGQLVSCLATVRVRDTVAVCSVAPSLPLFPRGHGAAAVCAALASAAQDGATSSLLSSSAAGEALYRALGYRELERWDQWSRPRWVLARA